MWPHQIFNPIKDEENNNNNQPSANIYLNNDGVTYPNTFHQHHSFHQQPNAPNNQPPMVDITRPTKRLRDNTTPPLRVDSPPLTMHDGVVTSQMYTSNFTLPPAIPSSTYNLPPYYYYGSSYNVNVPPKEYPSPPYRPHYNHIPYPYPSPGMPDHPPPVSAEDIYHQQMFYNQWAPPRDIYYDPNYLHTAPTLPNKQPHVPVEAPLPLPQQDNTTITARFMLVEQPEESQRKAYKTENNTRCLVPNPFVITIKPNDTGPPIQQGQVSVKLLSASEEEIVKVNLLQCANEEDSLSKPLESDLTAKFSLKIIDTTEGNHFRLMFLINYTTSEQRNFQEKVITSPFAVYSNRKKIKDRPTVLSMKPTKGPLNTQTEVWIKGRNFCDRVTVMFGKKIGKIIEISDNLIAVFAPAHDTSEAVEVEVSNRYATDVYTANNKLSFLYQ